MQVNVAPPNGHHPWAHVPLAELFQEAGLPIKPKRNGQFQAPHSFKHSSKSGFPLVIWPDNHFWCSSCHDYGDAADFWVQIGRATDRSEAERLLSERCGPPGASERPHLTDLGNAKRLVEACGDRIRYCFPWGKWLVWTGKQWKIDDEGLVLTYAKSIPKRLYSEAGELAQKAASEPNEDRRATLANQAKALLSWAKTSETRGRLDNMIYLVQIHD